MASFSSIPIPPRGEGEPLFMGVVISNIFFVIDTYMQANAEKCRANCPDFLWLPRLNVRKTGEENQANVAQWLSFNL